MNKTLKRLFSRAAMTLAFTVLTAQTVWAQGTYASTIEVDGITYSRFIDFNAYDGTSTEYTYENNHYRYLVDGGWTNWAVEYANQVEPFIEFDTKKPIIPKGYILTTGTNTAAHPNRRPKGWVLKAKRYPGDEWTTIDEQTDYELPATDHEDVVFKKESNENVYQYFRLDISRISEGEDIVAYSHVVGKAYITELCELQFYGSEYNTTHDLYYASFQNLRRYYPQNAVTLNYTVKNSAGTELIKGTDYTETIRNSSNEDVTEFAETGTYTLTITGTGSYSGSLSSSFVVYEKLAGSGSKTDPYIIGDAAQWQVFATSLNEGNNYFNNYIKLAEDFDNSDEPITMMASTSDNPNIWFCGHFDGNGRTLYINLSASTESENFCAPFRQTVNADIHDLNVAGTITMKDGAKHAGSIVGCVHIGGTITNCHSIVTITDDNFHDGSHGGMVGLTSNYCTLRFTNCSFQGKILGNGNSCGGFVGWNSDGCAISYNNCLFKPSELGDYVKNNSATFNRSGSGEGAGTSTFTDAYYFEGMNLGLVQGVEVSGTHPNERMYKKVIAADGNTYYSDEVYSYLYTHERYRLTSGGAVQPLIVITHGNTVLTEGTDYTIDYSYVNSAEAGSYPIIIAGKGNYAGYLMKTLNLSGTFGMTVCEGSEENGFVPFYGMGLTDFQKTEFVIPASELTAMNGQTIKELKFYMTSSGSNWPNTFTVFMKEVDFTTFPSESPSFIGTADATQVFSGQPTVANQTVTFTFKDNYQYQGGNLLIGCYVEKGSGWSYISFYGKNVTGACIHGRNEYSLPGVNAKRYDFLPTVSFGYDLVDLANEADNTTVISTNTGAGKNVILSGHTFYKDGKWNTLCLPFGVVDGNANDELTFTGTPLEGAIVKTLTSTDFADGELTLNFTEDADNITTIEAGKPYIVKWASGNDITNPVFTGVTISATTANVETGYVDFIGTYSPVEIYEDGDEKHNLYLGAANTLYYPTQNGYKLNACRAYFKLKNGLTAGDTNSQVRTFVLGFGDEGEKTGITTTNFTNFTNSSDAWYDLSGRKLSGKPSAKGLYINNGKKVVIK